MKLRTALLLIPVLLAFCVGTAVAKPPPRQTRLDPSYGRKGVAKTATTELTVARLAVTPEGRSYVLQGMTVLAFAPNGRPAPDFGTKGRVTLTPAGSEGSAVDIAVDSKGRIVVVGRVGSREMRTQESFVIRLLPNGDRDPQFGSDGEVDTRFGIPVGESGRGSNWAQLSFGATTVAVDSQDRPIIGGQTAGPPQECYFGGNSRPVPFVARLTTSGAADASFFGAGAGYALGTQGTIEAMALAPVGELVLLTNLSVMCQEHENRMTVETGRLTETGLPSPALDPARPIFQMEPELAVDQHGRSIVIQTEEFSEQPGVVVRLLASGDVDRRFGFDGGLPLAGRLEFPRALAVDDEGRPIIASGSASVELLRLRTDGKIDQSFGPRGVINGGGAGNYSGSVEDMELDARGRIYVLSAVKSTTLKTGCGIQVARFVPGS